MKWISKILLVLFLLFGVTLSGFLTYFGHPIVALICVALIIVSMVIFLKKSAYPFRFMYPGLVTFSFFMVLPIIFTVIIGFTNLGTGHLLSKDAATKILLSEVYTPEGGKFLTYGLSNEGDTYTVHATDELKDGNEYYSASFNLDSDETIALKSVDSVPTEFISKGKVFRILKDLKKLRLSLPTGEMLSFSRINSLSNVLQKFQLNEDGTITDNATGTVYSEDNERGFFVNGDDRLSPGYYVGVGFSNFTRLFVDDSVKESFMKIFIWTMIWAAGSVFLSFSLGISLALLVNNKKLKGKAIYRVLLIIPYSIPFFISILVFRGLMNKDFGIINEILSTWGLGPVNWLGDPIMAKISCLLVNLWLGFPYMFLVTTGILQSIPESVYEAALIDGAGRWDTFKSITLPMTFSAVAPLLVGSFAFNMNNFVGIYLLTGGGPPIAGATTPAGDTDILISYTYRLAFEAGGGQDFGLASSIAIIIFLIIAAITLVNFKASGMFKESK